MKAIDTWFDLMVEEVLMEMEKKGEKLPEVRYGEEEEE